MTKKLGQFTETDTEDYYDEHNEVYKTFWDEKGSLHWGYFESGNHSDFQKASSRLTEMMIDKSGIDALSKVLDIGCGNGTVTIEIAKRCLCAIYGIDLSGVRIQSAQDKLNKLSKEIKDLVSFQKGTATKIQYQNENFTHVWSQATIYHVHDKEKAFKEICRVLKQGGVFIFDDLFKSKSNISDEAKKHVYRRLLFDTPLSFVSYQVFLRWIGFEVCEAHDLSTHLKRSYEVLVDVLLNKIEGGKSVNKYENEYKKFIKAYKKTINAIDNGEVGWGLFVCRKPA